MTATEKYGGIPTGFFAPRSLHRFMSALDEKAEKPLDHCILNVVREDNPKTVEELIECVQSKYSIPKKEILTRVSYLQSRGVIVLREHPALGVPLFRSYILSTKAIWYWAIIAMAVVTAALVFIIPENTYPIAYARYLFGGSFVLFLPGYSFIKALFPAKELDNIETIALSIGLSLTLVIIVGLLLNYTPWGIRTTSVTLSLLGVTIILATVSIIRERQAQSTNALGQK